MLQPALIPTLCSDSVPWSGHLLPVTLRQLHILLDRYTSKRAIKRRCASQRHDFTYINSKYKVVFIVRSGLDVTRISGLQNIKDAQTVWVSP